MKKKILLAIPYFMLYILYVVFTLEARNRYSMGTMRGMYCTKSHSSGLIGESHTFYYDPHRKPVREYLTWKEYWNKRGY